MVGPNYRPPIDCVGQKWEGPLLESIVKNDEVIVSWWNLLQDPLLTKCIERAISCNYNLAMAQETIVQARAVRQVKASSLFPQIIADMNGTKTYFSKNGPVFAIGVPTASGQETTTGNLSPTTGLPFEIQIPQIQNLFNALFDATWEIDLFGKIRRGVEAASAMIGAAVEQRNDLLISIAAEVAKNYIELRAYQKGALLVEETIALLEKKAEILTKSQQNGYANEIDVESTEAELSLAKGALPLLIAKTYRSIYAISLLTSKLPEELLGELLEIGALPALPEKVSAGLRSDLLKRRPDVRQAERKLAAATAGVGVAVGAFFPSITIGSDGGFQSLSIKNLFQGKSKTWAIGGDINLPIFEGGKLVANYRASKATLCSAAYTYQQTVLQAIQETESALISYQEDLAICAELFQNREHHRHIVFLEQKRYEEGMDTLIALISKKQQEISAQEALLLSRTAALVDFIALYKSLGGGWQEL